jgi:signal transduction histidine kinase
MPLGWLTGQSLLAVGPPLVASGVTAWLAIRLFRGDRRLSTAYTDLVRPFRWACIAFAGAIAALALVQTRTNAASDLLFVLAYLFFLPWTAFAFSFVERGHLVTQRRVAVGGVLSALLVVLSLFNAADLAQSRPVFRAVGLAGSVLALGLLGVVFTAGGLVVLATYRHRTLSAVHGAVVVLPVVLIVFGIQLTRPSLPRTNDVVVGVVALAVAGSLVAAVTRYGVLGVRAGIGTAGERAAVREMDEVILTVERDGVLARANRAAVDAFGDRLGADRLSELVGHDPSALAGVETVESRTADGRRQFDPRVTELTNQHGEVVGYTVVLIDVTDREIRRQRLEVLNRTLRHNVRNKLDVVRADAERLADEERADSIVEATTALERLSGKARRIERLLGRSRSERTPTDAVEVVESVTAAVEADHPGAVVSVDVPASSATVDGELFRFALRNLVENAVVHNDGPEPRVSVRVTATGTGTRVVVADDGPGIPEAERSVIESSTESPLSHASGIGLWGASWAVQQLGGDLSFEESDLGGTAVVVELPAG